MTTVLIADDDPRIRLLLRTFLRDAGHDVWEVADGEAALQAIRERPPSVAILDVQMPGLSGLEVCRRVRADPRLARARLLVVSANATEADALTAGADAFLAKPFSPARLLAAVDDLASTTAARRSLREWRAERLLAIRDLARAAGVAPAAIEAIETGARRPGRRMARRIAVALAVDPSDVAEFHPGPPSDPGPSAVVARLDTTGYPELLARRVAERRPAPEPPE